MNKYLKHFAIAFFFVFTMFYVILLAAMFGFNGTPIESHILQKIGYISFVIGLVFGMLNMYNMTRPAPEYKSHVMVNVGELPIETQKELCGYIDMKLGLDKDTHFKYALIVWEKNV